jgi:hypothetical protein
MSRSREQARENETTSSGGGAGGPDVQDFGSNQAMQEAVFSDEAAAIDWDAINEDNPTGVGSQQACEVPIQGTTWETVRAAGGDPTQWEHLAALNPDIEDLRRVRDGESLTLCRTPEEIAAIVENEHLAEVEAAAVEAAMAEDEAAVQAQEAAWAAELAQEGGGAGSEAWAGAPWAADVSMAEAGEGWYEDRSLDVFGDKHEGNRNLFDDANNAVTVFGTADEYSKVARSGRALPGSGAAGRVGGPIAAFGLGWDAADIYTNGLNESNSVSALGNGLGTGAAAAAGTPAGALMAAGSGGVAVGSRGNSFAAEHGILGQDESGDNRDWSDYWMDNTEQSVEAWRDITGSDVGGFIGGSLASAGHLAVAGGGAAVTGVAGLAEDGVELIGSGLDAITPW